MVLAEDAANAAVLAETLRSTIAAQFDAERERIRVGASKAGVVEPPMNLLTVSIGIANLGRHAGLKDALKAVDEANQRAKVAGGNRVGY